MEARTALTISVIRTTHALLPLLHKAQRPRVVNVMSGRGSFTMNDDPQRIESRLRGLVYPVSKAALNMLTYQYARALPGFRINAVDPGFTATAINNHTGTSTPAQSARRSCGSPWRSTGPADGSSTPQVRLAGSELGCAPTSWRRPRSFR
ncbi:SDR family NAD(P)-dependent oxidoreductase [Streptomyces sp. NPDC058000]|uniref:SDR family NAD(P)-dependent oxidoreductase n=1 Tax=Streptomyces sp. NPDC058000 TaxID=3346299 RepID=UPI0036E31D57